MKPPLICMRCGRQALDVAPTLVDLEAEAAAEGRRVRVVEVELVKELRHVEETTRVTVPELFGTEYRCRDRWGCDERYFEQLAAERAAATTTESVEEDVPWL